MKKLSFISLLAICFMLVLAPQSQAAFNGAGSHKDGLDYLLKKGAIEESINYNASVTRAQFASYIVKSLQITAYDAVSFTDVPKNSPYYEDIARAVTAGIVTGYTDDTFKPDTYISRQHMAVMLDRLMDYAKIDKKKGTKTFADHDKINADYRDIVMTASEMGIIQGKQGYFNPQNNATIAQSATFIYRTMQYTNDPEVKPGEKPEEPDNPAPTGDYQLQKIEYGRLIPVRGFASFSDASKAMGNNHVITLHGRVVNMGTGFAVANKYISYKSENINDVMAVAENTEMEFISSDGKNARVRLSGHVSTVSLNDITLYPFGTSKGRSYYQNVNGELIHYLYKHSSNQYYASYVVGKAPSSMKPNVRYHSWNGIHFNGDGTSEEAYNYYQFLPARSTTSYTAQEIDNYVMQQLRNLDANGGIWINGVNHKNAASKSKLIGIGPALKRVEQQHNINAMLILSLAFHESAYGMSDHAQKLNNLFGLYVYDTNPLNKNFASIEANINELVSKFWQPNYITPGGWYANGAVVGSKAFGFNVKYASDPFWGAKIAGHYYRADRAMGFKDAGKYTIGLTTSANLPVRTVATTYNNTPFFTYKRAGMPVIITSGNIPDWYELLSDKLYNGRVYVPKANVRIIPTVK